MFDFLEPKVNYLMFNFLEPKINYLMFNFLDYFRNGGTCLWSIDGFQCHCKLQFSGRYCQSRIQVSTPGIY